MVAEPTITPRPDGSSTVTYQTPTGQTNVFHPSVAAQSRNTFANYTGTPGYVGSNGQVYGTWQAAANASYANGAQSYGGVANPHSGEGGGGSGGGSAGAYATPNTYRIFGQDYSLLGRSHLNLNPEVGYKAYTDHQFEGKQHTPFGAFLQGQFRDYEQAFQVESARNPGLMWTDYLERLGSDPLIRFRNLSPEMRHERGTGRSAYGF